MLCYVATSHQIRSGLFLHFGNTYRTCHANEVSLNGRELHFERLSAPLPLPRSIFCTVCPLILPSVCYMVPWSMQQGVNSSASYCTGLHTAPCASLLSYTIIGSRGNASSVSHLIDESVQHAVSYLLCCTFPLTKHCCALHPPESLHTF